METERHTGKEPAWKSRYPHPVLTYIKLDADVVRDEGVGRSLPADTASGKRYSDTAWYEAAYLALLIIGVIVFGILWCVMAFGHLAWAWRQLTG